jgi:hypothetical protein
MKLSAVRPFIGLRSVRRTRRGLSLIEFTVCLVAIVAGVLAGAAYLKIDLIAALQLGMEKVGLASPAPIPAANGPVPEGKTSAAAPDTSPQRRDSSAKDAASGDSPAAGTDANSLGAATLNFWNHLRETIHAEHRARLEGERTSGGDPHTVLAAHRLARSQAAAAIRQLSTGGVDALATELALDLANWFDEGSRLAAEGTLLDKQELTAPQSPQGRRWHSSKRQHEQERNLLDRKILSVQRSLAIRYKIEFPELR